MTADSEAGRPAAAPGRERPAYAFDWVRLEDAKPLVLRAHLLVEGVRHIAQNFVALEGDRLPSPRFLSGASGAEAR